PWAVIRACGRSIRKSGARRSMLAGSAPSETVYEPASSLETTCAASSRGAGTSSAVLTARIATFRSFMLSRALVLLLPLGRRHFAWDRAARRLPNPVLQRRTRIQPLEYVGLDAPPQAVEGCVVRAVLPELGNRR